MRTSFLTRSVIAVASAAIGSALLVAAPAQAADPPVINHDLVMKIAKAFRSQDNDPSLRSQFEALISRGCTFTFSEDNSIEGTAIQALPAGTSVDGLLLSFDLREVDDQQNQTERTCVFSVLTPSSRGSALSGTSILSATSSAPGAQPIQRASALSGEVHFTAPINLPADTHLRIASIAASGDATSTYTSTMTERVPAPKSKAQKKAAKAKYSTQLKSAKKTYTKAVKKAGSNKSKKARAKKTYNNKVAAAKRTYTKAIATTFKVSTKTTTQIDRLPFTFNVVTP